MSRVRTRLEQYKAEIEKKSQYKHGLPGSALDIVNTLLNDLEQDEKENGWIPVSERLPERDWCLAVFRELDTGYQLIPRVAEFINRPDDEHATSDGWHIIDFFEGPKEYIKLLKCVAWMPLPEPYK
jgi:hypothetical protein